MTGNVKFDFENYPNGGVFKIKSFENPNELCSNIIAMMPMQENPYIIIEGTNRDVLVDMVLENIQKFSETLMYIAIVVPENKVKAFGEVLFKNEEIEVREFGMKTYAFSWLVKAKEIA